MYFNLLTKAWLHLYIRILRVVGTFYNPLVTRKIGAKNIQLPFAHELPVYIKLFPLYSVNLSRILKTCKEFKKDLCVIDIGANIGDTVALLSDIDSLQVLCVEGDTKYHDILKSNTSDLQNVLIANAFLGERKESLNVKIDGSRGTGQLVEDTNSIEIETLDNLLAQFDSIKSVDLIKIDTDGFDNAIIRGSTNIISKDKPIIFFEWMPDVLKEKEVPEDIFNFLHQHGYARALVYDNYGFLIGDVDLADMASVSAVLARFYGHGVSQYADIAAFHAEGHNVYQECAKREVEFFRKLGRI